MILVSGCEGRSLLHDTSCDWTVDFDTQHVVIVGENLYKELDPQDVKVMLDNGGYSFIQPKLGWDLLTQDLKREHRCNAVTD